MPLTICTGASIRCPRPPAHGSRRRSGGTAGSTKAGRVAKPIRAGGAGAGGGGAVALTGLSMASRLGLWAWGACGVVGLGCAGLRAAALPHACRPLAVRPGSSEEWYVRAFAARRGRCCFSLPARGRVDARTPSRCLPMLVWDTRERCGGENSDSNDVEWFAFGIQAGGAKQPDAWQGNLLFCSYDKLAKQQMVARVARGERSAQQSPNARAKTFFGARQSLMWPLVTF